MTLNVRNSIILLATLSILPTTVFAATPTAIISWKASGYVPRGYAGKVLPIAGSTVTTSLVVTDENGVVMKPSSYAVRWYVDGNLITTHSGTRTFTFPIPRTGQNAVTLRASVPDAQGAPIDAFADIPVVRPDVAIDRAKFPALSPLFYFFSIKDPSALTVTWDDTADSVTVRAKNPVSPLEFSQTTISKNL